MDLSHALVIWSFYIKCDVPVTKPDLLNIGSDSSMEMDQDKMKCMCKDKVVHKVLLYSSCVEQETEYRDFEYLHD